MSMEKSKEVNTVHHHSACCLATLSPLVSIHHIGITLSGVYLHRIKGLGCVKGG